MEPSKEIVKFEKELTRELSLFIEVLWAKGMEENPCNKFGWKNPYLPLFAFFVDDGLLDVWENKKSIDWFLNNTLRENQKGTNFLGRLFEQYLNLIKQVKIQHSKGYISDPKELGPYRDLVYEALFVCSVFFYVGMDGRSPQAAKEICVQSRREIDLFAECDAYFKSSFAQIWNITEEMAGVVLPSELFDEPTKDILEKRLKAFLLIDGEEPFYGNIKDFSKANQTYVFVNEKISIDGSEFSGQSAQKGIVKGSVRIIRKRGHLERMQEGDILVTSMTTPDLLPAMQKASAFITDEGGITCHAAIVAREMKKPCIIGTKIATKVLKDGDLVEVDANKGVVRIIKNKNNE